MDNTEFSIPSRLIILGNGSDLQAGLKSSFSDYFDSLPNIIKKNMKYNIGKLRQTNRIVFKFPPDNLHQKSNGKNFLYLVDNNGTLALLKTLFHSMVCQQSNSKSPKSLSFFDYLFIYQQIVDEEESTYLWKDIEDYISKFLKNDLTQIMKYINFLLLERPWLYNKEKSKNVFLTYVIMDYFNQFKDLKEIDEITLANFLKEQLFLFENNFKNYLFEQEKDNNYNIKSSLLLNKLVGTEKSTILSFNYTRPTNDSSLYCYRNVHGSLSSHIIIGIDQTSLPHDNKYLYEFSKTYRIMQLASDRQEKHILNKNIKSIIFYGHSLAEADYSYFQSIFDFYSIYDSDVTLVFYYSVYDENKKQDIIKTQFDSIRKLLMEYGDTLDNKDHGKNLLHKLLLEDRLIIKELVLDDSNHEEK